MIKLIMKVPRLEMTNREYLCAGKLWKYIFQSGELVVFVLQCFMKRSWVNADTNSDFLFCNRHLTDPDSGFIHWNNDSYIH